jgi:hypothetical protein
VRWADLSVVLERSRFVAYTSGIYYPPGPAAFGVTTAEGLRAGDPVAKLRRAYGDAEITKPPPSGFEGERWIFTAATQGGDVTGVIEGDRTNGRVVAITAGSHCNTGG